MRPWLFITLINLPSIFAQECITPNGVRAECILLDNCDPVYEFLDSHRTLSLSRAQRQFINLLQCYEDEYGRSIVCCAADDPFFEENRIKVAATETVPSNGETMIDTRKNNFKNKLPNPLNYECGGDVLSNRIVGGSNAELGEFPWLALLEYQHPYTHEKSFSCGGSLIHRRYILTAAHCTAGTIIRVKGKLINVRLGEHNLNTTVDCEVSENGKQVCAPPVINVAVEFAIAHPNYSQVGVVPYNDVGLVRLAYDINTTEFIQPICLLTPDKQSPVGTFLTASGWGRTRAESHATIKQKVKLPVIDFKHCLDTFYPVKINSETQLCAGAEADKDTCNGDSGGPLMVFLNGFWFIEGIVSFGPGMCGLDGISGVYTRVNSYSDWILSTIT